MPRRTLILLLALGALLAVGTPVPVGASAEVDSPTPRDDLYLPQQWGLERINAPAVWSVTEGEGVTVAVVDSGVALGHPDLIGAFATAPHGDVLGIDLVDRDDVPADRHGHGTMIAGIIAARIGAGYGLAGVAPRSSIMPVRVLDEDAAGRSLEVDEAIRWAVDNGADIINLSLELGRDGDGLRDDGGAPVDAVRHAWAQGVIVVAAAGNEGSEAADFPADAPVLVVGASDRDDRLAPFTDVGHPDVLLAPGVDIISTWCRPCGDDATQTLGVSDGTSYAAAHVSGALALLLAAGVGPNDAVRHLRGTGVPLATADPLAAQELRRIDVAAAMRAAGRELGADDEPLIVDSRSDVVRVGAAAAAGLLIAVNIIALLRWRRWTAG